ncbi:hypothetical protein [Burkholderia pyrrocinia]
MWRKVHREFDASIGQLRELLISRQDVANSEVLPELLDQIPTNEPFDINDADDAYATIRKRGALESITPRDGPTHWPPRGPPYRLASDRTRCTREAVQPDAELAFPQPVCIA